MEMYCRKVNLLGAMLLLIVPMSVRAQAPQSQPSSDADKKEAPKQEERSTGLPKSENWTFNFDAAWGTFGFGNSLYTDVRPDPSENLGNNWFEGFIKPALSGH